MQTQAQVDEVCVFQRLAVSFTLRLKAQEAYGGLDISALKE